MEIILAMLVGVGLVTSVQWCPFRLVLEQAHGLDILGFVSVHLSCVQLTPCFPRLWVCCAYILFVRCETMVNPSR